MAEIVDNGQDAASGKSNKKTLIVIIAALTLVILIGAGAAAYFFLKEKPAPEDNAPTLEVPVPAINKQTDIGPMVDIKEFIVNIISAEDNHYVKASLTIELSGEMVQDEIQKRMPQIRDAILLLVGNKTFEELHDLQGKKQLKAELLSKINAILQTGQAKSIYFTDFVVQ